LLTQNVTVCVALSLTCYSRLLDVEFDGAALSSAHSHWRAPWPSLGGTKVAAATTATAAFPAVMLGSMLTTSPPRSASSKCKRAATALP
jgi:hypothetical protein